MNELARTESNLPEPFDLPGRCSYCGAPLQANFYFCLACATPYKSIESVLPDIRPAPPTEGELILKKAPHVWPLFWTFLGVVVGSAVLCFTLMGPEQLVLTMIVQTVALFVTTCIFAAYHWPSLAVQFRQFGFHRPAALIGLLALVPLLAVNYYYHGWLIGMMEIDEPSIAERFLDAGLGPMGQVFLICICPAVLEEIAFRGLVQHWLQVAIAPMRALILASFLFTAMHFSVVSAPYLFAVGMLLGWVKLKTGSLYPSMLIHLLHNWVVLVFFWT